MGKELGEDAGEDFEQMVDELEGGAESDDAANGSDAGGEDDL
jgi:hypothetical protein